MKTFKGELKRCIKSYKRTSKIIKIFGNNLLTRFFIEISYTQYGACHWFNYKSENFYVDFARLYRIYYPNAYITQTTLDGTIISTISDTYYRYSCSHTKVIKAMLDINSKRIIELEKLLEKI